MDIVFIDNIIASYFQPSSNVNRQTQTTTTTASPDPITVDARIINSTTTPTSEITTPRTPETTLDDNVTKDEGTALDLNRGYKNSAFL